MTVDLELRRSELLALRERLHAAASDLTTDDDPADELSSAAGDQHLADHASDILDRELDDTLGENADHVIRAIDDALRRLDEGTYGTCVVCGEQIPEERLAAIPYATLCLADRRSQEGA